MKRNRRAEIGRIRGALCLVSGTVLVCLAAILLSGCSQSGSLYDYANGNGRYRLTFPSPAGDVVCLLEGDGTARTLTVLSPPRSESVTVTFNGERCTLTAGGTDMVLSPAASAELRELTALLYRGEAGAAVRRAGEDTRICYGDGTVTLGEDRMPRALTLGTWTVKAEALPDDTTEESENTNG